MMNKYLLILMFCTVAPFTINAQPFVLILGVAQDGGYPHIGCKKQCCARAWGNDMASRYVVSFAVVDPAEKKWWLFEATPDIKEQLQYFNTLTSSAYKYLPDGIFITHAHIGHYTGLMQLGREALGAKGVDVYVLPKMMQFLQQNGPWSQLVALNNINLHKIMPGSITGLTTAVKVLAFSVPHRDEYSETAGFTIMTPKKKYLFIPDIDKWSKWEKGITEQVRKVDVALVDATFYDNTELPGRSMTEVPHPFVKETMQLFSKEDAATKAKIYFIHFNHTNPLLWNTDTQTSLDNAGFRYAIQGMRL